MERVIDLSSRIDYEMLFDRKTAQSYYGVEPEPAGRYYDDDRGMVVRTHVDGGLFRQDLIQFEPDVLAFAGFGSPFPLPNVQHHVQTVGDEDWIHFTLCLDSAICENVLGQEVVEQERYECTITRYPARSVIDRMSRLEGQYKIACLWLKPAALLRLLETTESRIPDELFWLKAGRVDRVYHASIPLTKQMYHAVNDILACNFSGGVRRAFVRSKYLELLSTIYQSLADQANQRRSFCGDGDHRKIAAVASYLTSNPASKDSLADIARRVGMNRTKLVTTFKEVYGTSVEAYWRDWRLQKARDLLVNRQMSVSEVAQQVGYSEISAFTRAFSKQFGIAPKKYQMK
jgi:AraC family transcriptional activator of pyochelin receptor